MSNEIYVRRMLDATSTAESIFIMGMVSDAQELMMRGMLPEAIEVLNNVKAAIDLSLGERDEHGRHIKTNKRFE